MSVKISLNRSQVEKLAKMAEHFKEAEWFSIVESRESGIGPTISVQFNLFDKEKFDTKIDITDVSTW
jgi:hypothetical protein